ncbi:MAG: DNA-binding response regulator [Herbaspirillum sp.]|jgi:two-component system OmpR family response regulator|nr:DNA-binding response regulator [Herbaspirillum sp.]
MKILIVEDNERVAHFLKSGLLDAGYTIEHAADGQNGMRLATEAAYDVIIMDRMLPGGVDGLGIIEALRGIGCKTPILILSALSDVDERIRGLKAGCDDYLVKPFAFEELLARLDALLRRTQEQRDQAAPSQTRLTVGDLTMDLLSHQVKRGGQTIQLLPREFKLLEYLMRHSEQIVTRTMLLENVWDYHFDPQTNVVDVHISKLRQKFDTGTARSMLRTIRSAGYMLTAND